jgi:type II secretory pathway component PulF
VTTFAYTAFDATGKTTRGTLPADTRAAALADLSRQGLIPTDLSEAAGRPASSDSGTRTTRVPKPAVDAFTRELANLLAGGLSLSRALALLKREVTHAGAKRVWGQVHDDVVSGTPLAEALAKRPDVFGEVYVAMVRAGEAGGFLDVVLAQIAEFKERERDLVGKVKAALVYPVALAGVAVAVLAFLLVFFIPRFSEIFNQFGRDLPLMTRAVIALSGWSVTVGPLLLIGLAAGGLALRRYTRTPAGRLRTSELLLRLPLLGTVLSRFALVRFARMLGTLIKSGVPLVSALRVAKAALGNAALTDAVAEATEQVRRGVPLSRALSAESRLMPSGVAEVLAVAEETGRVGEELTRVADSHEKDLDRHLRLLVATVEPAMLLTMAVVIGTIVVSMLLPLFTLQDMVN